MVSKDTRYLTKDWQLHEIHYAIAVVTVYTTHQEQFTTIQEWYGLAPKMENMETFLGVLAPMVIE